MKATLLFVLLLPMALQGQDVNLKWAKQMIGDGNLSISTATTVDKLGNVYTTGHFGGTVDFDPGPGVYNLTRLLLGWGYDEFLLYDDMFISKLDAGGNFIWAKQIGTINAGGAMVLSIDLDRDGNIYTTGYFGGTLDFDPGPCKYELTAPLGGSEMFALKLTSEGEFLWAKKLTGYGFSNCAR